MVKILPLIIIVIVYLKMPPDVNACTYLSQSSVHYIKIFHISIYSV